MPVQTLPITRFLRQKSPIVDVRSPGEFERGHIPDSVNLPLFDDDERARIGTLYQEQGKHSAVLAGLEIAGPKMRRLVEDSCAINQGGPLRVLCWRGGQRSASFSWLLDQAGIQVDRLEGGYKSFRRFAHEHFSRPTNLVILSGLTGSGKTILLQNLRTAGEQIIDLEELAHHRGSAFGGIGQPPQPTTEQFENNLFQKLASLDTHRRIWIEDESAAIGKIRVPDPFWLQMRQAPVVFIEVPRETRVRILLDEYGPMPVSALAAAIEQITKRLGGDRKIAALDALRAGELERAVHIVLDYYDRAYKRSCSKRKLANAHLVDLPDPTAPPAVDLVISAANRIGDQPGRKMETLVAALK